eukprot:767847-Hanusia_phi.AAC.1
MAGRGREGGGEGRGRGRGRWNSRIPMHILLLLLFLPSYAEQSLSCVHSTSQQPPTFRHQGTPLSEQGSCSAGGANAESLRLICFMASLKAHGASKTRSLGTAPRSRRRSCQQGILSLVASGTGRRDGGMNELERAREALAGLIAKRRDHQAAYSFNEEGAGKSSAQSLSDRMAKSMRNEFKWLSEANAFDNFDWKQEDDQGGARQDAEATRDQARVIEPHDTLGSSAANNLLQHVELEDERLRLGGDDASGFSGEQVQDLVPHDGSKPGEDGGRRTEMFELQYGNGSIWIPGDDPLTRTKGYLLNRVFPGLRLEAHQELDDYVSKLTGESTLVDTLREFRLQVGLDSAEDEDGDEDDPFAKAFRGMELSVPLLSAKGLRSSTLADPVDEKPTAKKEEAGPTVGQAALNKQPPSSRTNTGTTESSAGPTATRSLERQREAEASDVVLVPGKLMEPGSKAEDGETTYDLRVVFADENTIGIRTTWSDGFEFRKVVEEVDLRTGKIVEIYEDTKDLESLGTGLVVVDNGRKEEKVQKQKQEQRVPERTVARYDEGMLVRVISKTSRYRNLVGLIVAVVGNGKRVRVQFAGLRQTALLQVGLLVCESLSLTGLAENFDRGGEARRPVSARNLLLCSRTPAASSQQKLHTY